MTVWEHGRKQLRNHTERWWTRYVHKTNVWECEWVCCVYISLFVFVCLFLFLFWEQWWTRYVRKTNSECVCVLCTSVCFFVCSLFSFFLVTSCVLCFHRTRSVHKQWESEWVCIYIYISLFVCFFFLFVDSLSLCFIEWDSLLLFVFVCAPAHACCSARVRCVVVYVRVLLCLSVCVCVCVCVRVRVCAHLFLRARVYVVFTHTKHGGQLTSVWGSLTVHLLCFWSNETPN